MPCTWPRMPKRVRQVRDLHRPGDAALEERAGARHVERPHLDPGRHVPVAAVRGLGGQHRDVERVAELAVAAELELAHRLLVPEEALVLEHPAELQSEVT